MQISQNYKSLQKEKLARTMYNSRQGEVRHKLSSMRRDYCPQVLGYIRFGLNQKPPISTDPNAPQALRFSQMACHRFAQSNSKFMDLYDKKVLELRKTRRFLANQINKSPEGKLAALKVLEQSPQIKNLSKKLHVQFINESLQGECDPRNAHSRSISPLRMIMDEKKAEKLKHIGSPIGLSSYKSSLKNSRSDSSADSK